MKVVDGREQDYKEWRNNNSDPYGIHICRTLGGDVRELNR